MSSNRKDSIQKIMAKGKKHFMIRNSLVFGIVFFITNGLLALAFNQSIFDSLWKTLVFIMITAAVVVFSSHLNWNSIVQEKNRLPNQ